MMTAAARIFWLFLVATTAITVSAQAELKVEVYEGPTVCDGAVKVGDRIGIHYVGTIDGSSETGEPGSKFDSSRDRNSVLHVTVGVGDLLDGWDKGLIGLCNGAKAILVVPPEMAYGEAGVGDIITGGATLRFDVEILSVSGPAPTPDLFEELDVDKDGVLTPDEIHAHFKKEGPDAEMPPNLIENEDANRDGVVSREEFGGPKMPWEMCLQMLHRASDSVTTDALAIQWICQRPRDLEGQRKGDEGNGEL